jgi:hypothetical protein
MHDSIFDLPLALECSFSCVMQLIPDECFDSVFFRETWHDFSPMLPDSSSQIVGHADVQGSVSAARQNIHKEAHMSSLDSPLSRE